MRRKAWFNPDGSPNMKHGSAVELYFYAARDNLIIRRSLLDTGAPTKAEDGHYSMLRQTFDVDRLTRKGYLDENGLLFSINGSAGTAYVYDSPRLAASAPHSARRTRAAPTSC